MKVVSDADTIKFFDDQYNSCQIRYGDLKKQLAEDIITFTTPIRERINEIYNDDDYLRKVVTMGAEKARQVPVRIRTAHSCHIGATFPRNPEVDLAASPRLERHRQGV